MFAMFLMHLKHYTIDIFPALAFGFFLSGIIREIIPQSLVDKYLVSKGVKPLLYVILIGILLPVCCIGSLPIALSLRKRGVPLGPVFAFLVATPATSISAILVTLQLFGPLFTIYLCFSVILIALIIGLIGNKLNVEIKSSVGASCTHCCEEEKSCPHCHPKIKLKGRVISALKFGFIDQPREIGKEILIGLTLAALVASIPQMSILFEKYIYGAASYVFALLLGLVMYFCSTASVPFVDALVHQGLNIGAGIVLLIAGPITSYSTMLVIRKEFGTRILIFYLASISILSVIMGYAYTLGVK